MNLNLTPSVSECSSIESYVPHYATNVTTLLFFCIMHFLSVFVFVLQRWSSAWTERDYQHNVFTNNGVEANNEVNFAIH